MNIDLSKKGIQSAISELRSYKESLQYKSREFVEKLADLGVNVAMFTLHSKGQGDSDRDADFNVSVDINGTTVTGTISLSSTPKIDKKGRIFYPHLAWEFGAGSYFNSTSHPKADEFGLGVGTFPNQTHAENDFWFYRDDDGLHKSYGTEATMPLYNALLEIMDRTEEVAREVFG